MNLAHKDLPQLTFKKKAKLCILEGDGKRPCFADYGPRMLGKLNTWKEREREREGYLSALSLSLGGQNEENL